MSDTSAALGRDREVTVVSPLDVLTERLNKAAKSRFTLREEVQRRYYPTPVVPHEKRGDEGWRRGVMVKSCGTTVIQNQAYKGVTITSKGVTNVQLCRSHYCVCCSHLRCVEDAIRMKNGIEEGVKQGYSFAFVTLTIPTHSEIDEQVFVLNEALKEWKVLLRSFVRNKAQYKGIGVSHSFDVTFRKKGFRTHLHLHCLVQAKSLVGIPFEAKWKQAVDKVVFDMSGGEKSYDLHHDACLVKEIELADSANYANYFAKYNGIANEVIGGESKYETKTSENFNVQDLLNEIHKGKTEPHFDYYRKLYNDFYEELEVNKIRWREISKTLSRLAKASCEEETSDEETDEREEELSLNVSGYNWSIISKIKGARQRIQGELRKEENESATKVEDPFDGWSSTLLDEIEKTNARLKAKYGITTAPNRQDNDFWNELDFEWERVFEAPVRWWDTPNPSD
jgi:hypothetical protein